MDANLLAESAAELRGLSVDQLTAILKHEAAYDMFLHDTAAVREVKRRAVVVDPEEEEKDVALTAAQTALEAVQRDVAATQELMREKLSVLKSSQERRQATLNQLRPRNVVENMQEAVSALEHSTEDTLRQYISGSTESGTNEPMPTEKFLALYTKERKQFYSDRFKLEKSGNDIAQHLVSTVTTQ